MQRDTSDIVKGIFVLLAIFILYWFGTIILDDSPEPLPRQEVYIPW